jgi:hypothetical protein
VADDGVAAKHPVGEFRPEPAVLRVLGHPRHGPERGVRVWATLLLIQPRGACLVGHGMPHRYARHRPARNARRFLGGVSGFPPLPWVNWWLFLAARLGQMLQFTTSVEIDNGRLTAMNTT